MKKKSIKIIFTIIFSLFLGTIIFKSEHNSSTRLDEVSLSDRLENNSDAFAVMIENGLVDGTYVESNTIPKYKVFNSELSGCVDNDGNLIQDSLTYRNGVVTINVGTSSHCYLYFDTPSLLSEYLIATASSNGGSDENLIEHDYNCDNSCAGDGKYRYSGANTEVNNYVCFGTYDLDECLNDTDTYLFRIIEIDPYTGNVKIIKNTPLEGSDEYISYYGSDNKYYWNGTDGTATTANTYTLNGKDYYNYWAVGDELMATLAIDLNTTYLSKFQEYWQYKIESYTWNVGGWDAPEPKIQTAYYYEIAENATFKIGLMNGYDYGYAADSSYWTLTMKEYGTEAYLYNWLFIGIDEHTIVRWLDVQQHLFWLSSYGYIYILYYEYYYARAVRPAFYLISNTYRFSGSGTLTDPYMIY